MAEYFIGNGHGLKFRTLGPVMFCSCSFLLVLFFVASVLTSSLVSGWCFRILHPFQCKVDYAWILDWPTGRAPPGSTWIHLDPGAEVVPEVLAGNDQPEDETFAAIMERFKYVEPEKKDISETL